MADVSPAGSLRLGLGDVRSARSARVLRGIAYVVMSTVLFVTMNAAVKYLRGPLPLVELVWARTVGQLVFMVALFAPARGWRLFVTRRPRMQALSSLCILLSTAMFFGAIGHVPLADATAVSFTSPVIVAVLSGPLLGEYLALGHWIAIAVGFAGAVVVARPTGAGADPFILLAAGNAVFYAAYQVLVRRLGRHDRPETTVTYAALGGALVLSLLVPFTWRTPHGVVEWGLLALSGLLGGLGHWCVARALLWAPAAIAAPFSYVQLLEAAALGYLVFGDVPGATLWIGAALIAASGLYIAWREVH
jgi:drug/metabolite transporter (DMT)-like permease